MIIRTYQPGDEEALVDLLNTAYPRPWGDVQRWRAKHLDRAGFSASHVFIAEIGGRLAGCLHCAVLPMRLGSGVVVPASIDGDLAVHPDMRGGRVAEELYAHSSANLARDGVVLRVGYSGAEARLGFYTRVLGYVAGFEDLRAYRKVIDPALLRGRLCERFGIAPDAPDSKGGAIVEISVVGLPALRLRLGPEACTLAASAGEHPALRVAADQRVLALFGAGGVGKKTMLRLLAQRVVRVQGTPLGAIRVARWVLERRLRRR
jgi:predicted N-acetyltransferase YhbS